MVELVIVIAVIGILAAIAIPRFISIRSQAYTAQRDGTVGSVRAGIMLVASQNQVAASPQATTFPPNLEATWGTMTGGNQQTTATPCNTDDCFELVLNQPVSDPSWSQATATTYTFAPPTGGTTTYTYTQATGQFN